MLNRERYLAQLQASRTSEPKPGITGVSWIKVLRSANECTITDAMQLIKRDAAQPSLRKCFLSLSL